MTQLGLDFEPTKEELSWLDDLDDDPWGLRWYQREAVEGVQSALQQEDSTLLVMATGLGKTRCFGAVAGDWDGRVLVLAHRDELVQQAIKRLEGLTNEFIGLEQAQFRSDRERIVVGSVQTVTRPKRLERLDRNGGFSLVICDEAHRYLAPTYQRVVEHYLDRGARVLGVTATPDRGDERALGQLFHSVAYEFDIVDGVDQGYLVPLRGERVHLDSIDLSGVRSSRGDLQVGALDEAMLEAVEGIVKSILDRWPDRCGPVFFPGKRSAEYAAERFNALRPGCAAFITDDTDREVRREIIRQCHRGDIQFLCNCLIATEGFDWPAASLVGMGRPTKSRSLYAQMAGRGTRPLPMVVDGFDGKHNADVRHRLIAVSPKPDCVLADFVGNSGKHSLMGPEDILGGRYSEAEVKRAKEKAEKEEGGDPREYLEQARREIQAMAASLRSQVTARAEAFDPFSIFRLKHDQQTELRYGGSPATPKQKAALERMGVDQEDLKEISKRGATKLIGTAIARRKKGLATFKQLRVLARWGWTNPSISFERARAALDYLRQVNWGKDGMYDPHHFRAILTRKQ